MVLLLIPLLFLFVFGLSTAIGSFGIWLINALLHYAFPVPMLGFTKTVVIAAAFSLLRMLFFPVSVRSS